ncbi:MAG: TadE/TadG family type IV pilus assembly protein [Granulosicoccus sp.]
MSSLCLRFNRQRGASLVEFSIVGLSIILIGLFTLQLGLLYHAKTTLNYAVFEAARAGAVNNASMSAIRSELGIRLAPLQGGDGSAKRAALAVARSSLNIKDPLNTTIAILNPGKAAFKDWAVRDPVSGKRFIPVNHLRHQTYDIGRHSGLSLRDANILKLQVTHGVDLRVPVVGRLMAAPMKWLDSDNAIYYLRGKWPIQSVAIVRMQSDTFEEEILKSADSASGTSGEQGNGQGGSQGYGRDKDQRGNPNDDLDRYDATGYSPVNEAPPAEDNGRAPDALPDSGLDTDAAPDDGLGVDVAAQTPADNLPPCDNKGESDQETASREAFIDSSPGLISTSQFREWLAEQDVADFR